MITLLEKENKIVSKDCDIRNECKQTDLWNIQQYSYNSTGFSFPF